MLLLKDATPGTFLLVTTPSDIHVGSILQGPLLPEPVEVLNVIPMGSVLKVIGRGVRTNQVHSPVLSIAQLALLHATPRTEPMDGDPLRFRLGVEGARLGLAYEYDPYFSLSIARVDPLPHQLEAVYDYFMRMPRIRFLLADDPGAGKTIMAGLLLKELKVRGLVRRTLIVAPANLTFQWQRELKEKFSEDFEVVRGETLRATYGQNPWQEKSQVVTSVSWVSRIEDARDSLLRSRWDLVIVDEAHRMSAGSEDKKTLAFQVGEELSQRTDHLLLMTATPHKGDKKHFRLFLSLLDSDVYADVKSLDEAMRRNEAPFYLRRTKEMLVSFPDPDTGQVTKLFRDRDVQTVAFSLDEDEARFYEALTRYVEEQSLRGASEDSARGRALGFTMAMLQRRFASSVYALRRSLERMRDRRAEMLENPDAWRKAQIERHLPTDYDDLPDSEQQDLLEKFEAVVVSPDPASLREDIAALDRLIVQAHALEKREAESKLRKLREVLTSNLGIFDDHRNKLLIFTEHKDTLDFLAGDGKDGRPLGKLREWGLTVTQIHGGMKIGDRDTPGTRISAEREFREGAQVMVATEAAGEGINLQFCWLMINYDLPWNPVRLEQRMGRIHRYGQERDCLIYNFASTSTREGRVLQKLLDRLVEIKAELGSDKVFNVIGQVFSANLLEKLFREMYLRLTSEEAIKDRIVHDVDPERFKRITNSTLEGLAKKSLNLSALVGRHAEARERRLVPEVIEDFFLKAAPIAGLAVQPLRGERAFRTGKVPRSLIALGEDREARFGRLGSTYNRITFDKRRLANDPTLEWVTPGHPLFEALRAEIVTLAGEDLRKGALFWDLQTDFAYRLDVFEAAVKDGRGHALHRRLFALRTDPDGTITVRQPTVFLDLLPAKGDAPPEVPGLPDRDALEHALVELELGRFLEEVSQERSREIAVVRRHVEISLDALIDRAQRKFSDLDERIQGGDRSAGLAGFLSQAETHLDTLNHRREGRLAELDMERHCTIADVIHMGRAWILPHPDRDTPELRSMRNDPEIERIAVNFAIAHEKSQGWHAESVELENKGFDLISRRFSADDPSIVEAARFIEVKGRAAVGPVCLTPNEHATARRLGKEYLLYVVYNCATSPELHIIPDPTRLGWVPIVKLEHYLLSPDALLGGSHV